MTIISRQQQLNLLAQACDEFGIHDVIICPGSRNAPLTLAFARHPRMKCRSVIDERSAGFIALGIAQQKKHPVVLICTSGTAGLNFYPAIAEAYYQQVPLLIFTADRPPELIDQWDGQTIRQKGMFEAHIRNSYELSADLETLVVPASVSEIAREAILNCMNPVMGPVHINVPLREPLYPIENLPLLFDYQEFEEKSTVDMEVPEAEIPEDELLVKPGLKVMLLHGANCVDNEVGRTLEELTLKNKIVVISDVVSNCHEAQNVDFWDTLLGNSTEGEKKVFQPDLLITTGTSVVSKPLRLFLRTHKPRLHWHLTDSGEFADPFQTGPVGIYCNPGKFLKKLEARLENWGESDYLKQWKSASEKISGSLEKLLDQQEFGEFKAVDLVLKHVPEGCNLQLSNSMPVRYVNILGIPDKKLTVNCNRGTSGIEGVVSTAIGAAMANQGPVVLLVGDVAFFYDSNAFWNKHIPANLKIVVLNNNGGGIFRLIEGPSSLPELEEFFETRHNRSVEKFAESFGLAYFFAGDEGALKDLLPGFFAADGLAVLEVKSAPEVNQTVFKEYKSMGL